jgi:hypothetical protein
VLLLITTVMCQEVRSDLRDISTLHVAQKRQTVEPEQSKTAGGAAQSPSALRLPIVIPAREVSNTRAARHEREIFNWQPEFNISDPAFDLRNRPYIRMRNPDVHEIAPGKIQRLVGPTWEEYNFFNDIQRIFRRRGQIHH